MVEDSVRRKLRAILSADVKGYSRMMGEDEIGTYQTLTANLESIRPIISEHKGRVFSSPGDAVMAEFSSVVDAVQCAVELQDKIEAANAEVPEDRKMQFRIGVNLGDVIHDGEQVYGDGVNIAARIETLAEPGKVSISRNVYSQVRNKLKFGYEYQGEHQVKNIAEIKQFCVKSKAFICPAVNVFFGIMVSELICSSMRTVIFIPQVPEVCLYPLPCMESVTSGREKISPVRVLLPYCCIIYFQKPKHGVVQHYIVLVMTFGVADVHNPMVQIDIINPQHSCLIGSYSTTVKKTEEYRDGYLPGTLLGSVGYGRQAVTGMEKIFQFNICKRMGNICASLLPWNIRFHNICFSPLSQVSYKTYNNIDS